MLFCDANDIEMHRKHHVLIAFLVLPDADERRTQPTQERNTPSMKG
jgi:hypothetical protein